MARRHALARRCRSPKRSAWPRRLHRRGTGGAPPTSPFRVLARATRGQLGVDGLGGAPSGAAANIRRRQREGPLRVGIAPRACHSGDYGSVLGIVDRGDGTHEVTYVAGLSGRYRVSVTIDGAHVDGSPFTVDVPLEAAAPDARPRSPTATLRLKTAPDWW